MLLSKRRKMRWNFKRSLFKNRRNCLLRTSTKGRLFRTFNFKGGLCNRRTGYCPCRALCLGGKRFLWILKNDPLRFHLILPFFGLNQRFVFEMCFIRSTIDNLCPIMIRFYALDFNECHSEEVISFFWCSV